MISDCIFVDKTYLQKPHCVTIENISSNKKKLQLRFVLKNKDLKGKVRIINLKLTVISVKTNSGWAIDNFAWAISTHADLY